jgi:hypothetical protein
VLSIDLRLASLSYILYEIFVAFFLGIMRSFKFIVLIELFHVVLQMQELLLNVHYELEIETTRKLIKDLQPIENRNLMF